MIGSIAGKIIHSQDQFVILETNGVGYEIFLGEGPSSIGVVGENLFLWIHTHVREDQIALFGFKELIQKKLFLLLTTVSGIGPKLAMAITTQLQPQELLDAVTLGQVKTLCRVSGVGRKVAERMVLELKDKLGHIFDFYEVVPSDGESEANLWQDLSEALNGLGFPDSKIRNVVKLTRQTFLGQTVEINALLKFALKKIKDC